MTEDLLANADLDGLESEGSQNEEDADKYYDDIMAEYQNDLAKPGQNKRPPPAVLWSWSAIL